MATVRATAAGSARRGLHAAVRLLRVAAVVVLGWLAVTLLFPACTVATRQRLIGLWARGVLSSLGIRAVCTGRMRAGPRLIVANHVSWLDILAIHAHDPAARFVAMAELQHWRCVRRLVGSAGTIYLQRRRPRDLRRAVQAAAQALREGDAVAVFPEGVVSDGQCLLPFHGNFLQAAIDAGAPVQAVALRYVELGASDPADPCAPAPTSPAVLFTGDITLAQSLWRLAFAEGLELRMHVLPVRPGPHEETRRVIARQLQHQVEAALARERPMGAAQSAREPAAADAVPVA
ncbi:MAG: 1-acyl-sn-glycerol-3-phosphate acyltransferase [Rubrivivax sp.]|nr:1-acyl-sn-glycerol-3-phosphate acyltransferase [Rubrivivax sp.]